MIYHLIMKIQDLPTFMRPREKLVRSGAATLKDYELLAILLRTGYEGKNALDVAKRLLQKRTIVELAQLPFLELSSLKGVGETRAALLISALEIARRAAETPDIPTITSPREVFHMVSFIKNKRKEHFLALYLNVRQQLISMETISIGTLDASIAHPRDVFGPALQHNASSVIIVHNHPSGDSGPSHEDLILTKRLKYAGKILGINLIDHIIVADKNYTSMKEQNVLPE